MPKTNIFSYFTKKFEQCYDFIAMPVSFGKQKAQLFYFYTLVDIEKLNDNVLMPLHHTFVGHKVTISALQSAILNNSTTKILQTKAEAVEEITKGSAVLVVEGEDTFLSLVAPKFDKRSITEPPTASVLKGPREGFIEDIGTNISMIRRRLKTENLVTKQLQLGRETKTTIVLVYLKNVASEHVVTHVEEQLNKVDIDGVLDSFYIQALLSKNGGQVFQRTGDTEKPDVLTARILEGRVGILVDGSPLVITVPYFLLEDLQSADDYYMHPVRASMIRMIRLVGIILAILLPGLYVAVQSYHYRILPINFLISLLSSIEGLSFPPLLEILFVLFLFEILSEASLRMPKHLGMALSIIGALVLGDTAVQAGIISPPAVMIVAISGITLYTVPNQIGPSSVLRTLFTVIGGVIGFYGIMVGGIFIVAYLASMDSFGTPYLAPYAPSIETDKKDAIIKVNLQNMTTRPQSIPNKNKVRMKHE